MTRGPAITPRTSSTGPARAAVVAGSDRPTGPARHRTRTALLALATLLLALVVPAGASAHAQLEGAVPAGGTIVRTAPATVEFRFSEAVQATDDAVQVTAPDGERADTGAPFHPGGAAAVIAVRLKPGLPQGSYTATYRVTSADGHPVSNGVVFSIGRTSATATSLSGALAGTQSGPLTRTTFGVVRALQYLSIALGVGGLLFALLVLRPAGALDAAGRRRTRTLVVAAALLGALTAALGVVLEGAEGAGTSLWSALDPDVVGDGVGTRFGAVWAIAAGCWLLIAAGSAVVLRPGRRRPALLASLLAIPALFVVLHPSLAGHAATQSPRAVLFVSITTHVAAMTVWVGGIAALLVVVPSILRAAPADRRGPLLAGVAGRFSRIAIWAVGAVALSGAVQGYVLERHLSALVDTAHGRAVLIKTVLLIVIAIVATRNHHVTVPRLRAEATTDAEGAGRALRRLVRAEALLLLLVFGVTGALSTYQPAVAIPPGPARDTVTLGPLRAVVTTTPARIGVNAVRIVLTDPRTGRPFTGGRAVELAEELPGQDAAALQQTATASPAEPGVYAVEGAPLTAAGEWRVSLTVRVSDFDQYDGRFDLRVRK